MNRTLSNLLALFIGLAPLAPLFSAEENFIVLNALTDEVIEERGPHINERVTPCSTFKIPLAVMGFDSGILVDESNPVWEFKEGYDDFLETWKAPQTPASWMKFSCVWFSRVLAEKLGEEKFLDYLNLFDYGNRDMSGGLWEASWINSSIKISPKEQALFIQKMVLGKLPVSSDALDKTKAVLFQGITQDGSKLYGKTGWTGSRKDDEGNPYEIGWFVGWIEKGQNVFPFAYYIRDSKIELTQRIPRTKRLCCINSF